MIDTLVLYCIHIIETVFDRNNERMSGMIFHKNIKLRSRLIAGITLVTVLFSSASFTNIVTSGTATAYADTDSNEKMEQRKALPIQSNSIENWPKGPVIGAQSAILMEMNTHTILYAKNIHEKNYPASTTKILTCLLAMQNCAMNEIITFTHDSIYDVPSDGSRLGGVDTGDTMPMEQALYCVLVQSANDVATAVGEHVAEKLGKEKTVAAFSELMNEKAKELGCINTNFTNCNGLYDDNHYTTAYDLALIGCAFFENELLCKMSSTTSYHFKLKPDDENDTWIATKNQLYKGKNYEYPHLLGSKTGYVSQSGQTLVSAAEKNGMKLVCVILTEETPYQFEDTISLFQYGFENFQKVSINDNEKKYNIDTMDFFDTENDLFGDSTPLISIENDAYVILPNTAEFSDAVPTLTYTSEQADTNVIASIRYTYSDVDVGSCNLVFYKSNIPAFSFATNNLDSEVSGSNINEPDTSLLTGEDERLNTGTVQETETRIIYINVKKVLVGILMAAALVILILFIASIINSYSFSPKGQSSKRRRQRRREIWAAKWQARRSARRRMISRSGRKRGRR